MRATRTARAMIVAIAAVALLGGCSMSNVDPQADVTVDGTVRGADGSPAGGTTVVLARVPDPVELLMQGMVAVGSLGLACLAEESMPICRTLRSTTTNAEGRYGFRMTGADVRGAFGQVTYFDLAAQGPAAAGQRYGPTASVGFVVQHTELTLPDLQFWVPDRMSVTPHAGHFAVDWAGDPPHGTVATVHLTHGRRVMWSEPVERNATIDARAMEDVDGGLHLRARDTQDGPGTQFRLSYTTPGIRLVGVAGAPPSRGAHCFVAGAAGPIRLSQCPLTDGQFDQGFSVADCARQTRPPSGPPGGCAGWVYLDLGTARSIGAVFIRNVAPSLRMVLETSDDATQWTERARTGNGDFQQITLPEEPVARYVRIRSLDGSPNLTGLTEISIWPTAKP